MIVLFQVLTAWAAGLFVIIGLSTREPLLIDSAFALIQLELIRYNVTRKPKAS